MLLACAACKPDPPPFIGEGAKNILIGGGAGAEKYHKKFKI